MPTSGGNFDKDLRFDPKTGDLLVRGPFSADIPSLIGTGLIRFLLIKKDSGLITSEAPRITQYYGFYNPQDDPENWTGNVPKGDVKSLAELGVADTTDVKARAIGAAVLVMSDPFGADIPGIHTVTWCQDVTVHYMA